MHTILVTPKRYEEKKGKKKRVKAK